MFDTHRMTAAATTKAIGSIKTRAASLTRDIHKAATAIMLQSLPHDMGGHMDASKVLPLCQALGGGMPRNSVILWFATFTNIRVTVSGGGKDWSMKLLSPADQGYKLLTEADIQAAIDTPYWENDPPKDIDTLDTDKLIYALMNKIKKAVSDGKVKDTDKARKQLAALSKLAPAK